MALDVQQNQVQNSESQVTKEKENNFERMRKMYENQLEQERLKAKAIQEELENVKRSSRSLPRDEDDEDDDEPYVDKRRLNKKLASFEQKTKQETKNEIQNAVQQALYEERKQNWIKQNPDFHQVMSTEVIQKFANEHPDLAEDILSMPEGFERQKLVYRNIKKLGVDKPPQKQSSIQDKVDANRRSPYYQPSGVSNPPYEAVGDFSPAGQKNSYDKMQQLKNRLRLG